MSVLKVAVVGHTNTGKTSLMRTLLRDVGFGEVSDRPAVTRVVEAAVLRADGRPVIELFDTPGLEDSIGLLERLEGLRGERRMDGIDVVKTLLESDAARGPFAQEAKSLRQVLASDVALYVIDVRDRVLGKHRDELTILGMCARPTMPVLNFVAAEGARTALSREHLARVNMHAVVEYDTVVFSSRDEERLFEKMRSLLDAHRESLDAIIEDRRAQRDALVRAAMLILAELMVDVTAHVRSVRLDDKVASKRAVDGLKQAVRDREQRAVDQLLTLFRFRADDVVGDALPVENGRWGLDLFSPQAMKQFGTRAGGAAAAGAMVGLTLDVMLAGLTLGTGTAAGAAVGGLFGALRTHGKRLVDRMMGQTELRCDDGTLRLLATRQLALVAALLRRGHASMQAIRLGDGEPKPPREAMDLLDEVKVHPHWSSLNEDGGHTDLADPARRVAVRRVADALGA